MAWFPLLRLHLRHAGFERLQLVLRANPAGSRKRSLPVSAPLKCRLLSWPILKIPQYPVASSQPLLLKLEAGFGNFGGMGHAEAGKGIVTEVRRNRRTCDREVVNASPSARALPDRRDDLPPLDGNPRGTGSFDLRRPPAAPAYPTAERWISPAGRASSSHGIAEDEWMCRSGEASRARRPKTKGCRAFSGRIWGAWDDRFQMG